MDQSMTQSALRTTLSLDKKLCASSPLKTSKSPVTASAAMMQFCSTHFKDAFTFLETGDTSDESESSDDNDFDIVTPRQPSNFSVCEIPKFQGHNQSVVKQFPTIQFYDHPGDCEADESFSFTIGTRQKAIHFDTLEDCADWMM